MKTAFVQHISHEIRTPLNIITGFAQVVSNPDFELTIIPSAINIPAAAGRRPEVFCS
jgi:signal transduction histidine kinase